MHIVLVVWMLAMISGLWWSRQWTLVGIGLTAVTFLATQASILTQASGWLQVGVLLAMPWLLALQRERDQQALVALKATEAQRSTKLGQLARSLLSLQHASQQLEAQITQLTEVYHVTKQTSRALHLMELFSALLETIPSLVVAKGLRLIDLSASEPHALRATRASDGRMVSQQPPSDPASSSGRADEEVILKAVAELSVSAPEGDARLAWTALWHERRPIGVLIADELPPDQLPMFSLVAKQLSLQLSRIHLYQQVEALAVTDALTGVSVRRAFLERATEELERSRRHGLSCTLLMADLDRFKEKNDAYGHLVGDVVLREVAALLQQHLRDIDLIARYGGEEIILLLIETTVEQAMPIAERLRQLIEVHPIRAYDEVLSQTISMGLAGFPEDAQTLEELIERADQALYEAKRAGRNRVMRWSPS